MVGQKYYDLLYEKMSLKVCWGRHSVDSQMLLIAAGLVGVYTLLQKHSTICFKDIKMENMFSTFPRSLWFQESAFSKVK